MNWPPNRHRRPAVSAATGLVPRPLRTTGATLVGRDAMDEHIGSPPPQVQSGLHIATSSGRRSLRGGGCVSAGYVIDGNHRRRPEFRHRAPDRTDPAQQHGPRIHRSPHRRGSAGGHRDHHPAHHVGLSLSFAAHNGQTVGMMAVGVRAVDRASGVVLSSSQAARRVLTFFFFVEMWEQISAVIGFHHIYGPEPILYGLFRLLALAALVTTALWPLGNPVNQTLAGQGGRAPWSSAPEPEQRDRRPSPTSPSHRLSWPGSPSSC